MRPLLFRQLALEVDRQQAVGQVGAHHLHMIGKLEMALKSPAGEWQPVRRRHLMWSRRPCDLRMIFCRQEVAAFWTRRPARDRPAIVPSQVLVTVCCGPAMTRERAAPRFRAGPSFSNCYPGFMRMTFACAQSHGVRRAKAWRRTVRCQ